MPLNNLSDWDRSGTLSPYKTGAGSQVISGITALLQMLQQQKQDQALRAAAGSMMGGGQVPAGVDAGKLYSELALEKNKTFAPQAPNEMQTLIDFMSKGQGGIPGVLSNATQPSLENGTVMPGTEPPPSNLPPSDMLMRGIMSKKFGVPYEVMQTPEEGKKITQQKAEEQATIAAEKERQVNTSKVSRLTDMANVIESRFAETSPKSGVWGPISGIIDSALKGLQITPNQVTDRAYVSFVKGFRAQLARAMGDVGNLSEPEQKAAMNLVPTLLDSKETAAKKLQNLREFIKTIQNRETETPAQEDMSQMTDEELRRIATGG